MLWSNFVLPLRNAQVTITVGLAVNDEPWSIDCSLRSPKLKYLARPSDQLIIYEGINEHQTVIHRSLDIGLNVLLKPIKITMFLSD